MFVLRWRHLLLEREREREREKERERERERTAAAATDGFVVRRSPFCSATAFGESLLIGASGKR
jgi:ElaB/YqjD/DUF883 family membrane-anchored ribosome-binding protein